MDSPDLPGRGHPVDVLRNAGVIGARLRANKSQPAASKVPATPEHDAKACDIMVIPSVS